jgi:hypothetical protein
MKLKHYGPERREKSESAQLLACTESLEFQSLVMPSPTPPCVLYKIRDEGQYLRPLHNSYHIIIIVQHVLLQTQFAPHKNSVLQRNSVRYGIVFAAKNVQVLYYELAQYAMSGVIVQVD